MSDEPEFHYFDSPEDLQRFLKDQQHRSEIAYNDTIHTFFRALQEMEPEHLAAMRSMMHNLATAPTEHVGKAAAYWEGVMGQIFASREKVCPACGTDHDQELAKFVDDNHAPVRPVTDPEQRMNLMLKYNVKPLDEADLHSAVECTGTVEGQTACGMTWINLEDRMLRKPDECNGCQIKSAHG
jgi:hypothetical protein